MSIYTNLAGIVERSKWVYDFYFDKSGKFSVMDAIHAFSVWLRTGLILQIQIESEAMLKHI